MNRRDEWLVELERVEEAPDGRVAVPMTMHLRGQASGAEFERRLGHLWVMRDGKLWHLTPYDDPDEPFRVAGLPSEGPVVRKTPRSAAVTGRPISPQSARRPD